ncbi:MAG: hypothetical protein P8P83_00310 [Rickettsiaceae bacterium]|nr:hypothetical protein [Rickettsiaceae bacterium]
MKNGETVEFDIGGVNSYMKQASGHEPNHDYITDLKNLQSQLHVNGINELRNALLNADLVTPEGLDAYNNNLPRLKGMLLEDLQNAIKIPELIPSLKGLKDKTSDQPNITPEDLEKIASYGANQNFLESVSDKILLDLNKDELSPKDIQTNLDKYLSDYKIGQQQFTINDSNRYLIAVKDKAGQMKSITMSDLGTLGLTGEQKDSIWLLCHQGNISGATIPIKAEEDIGIKATSKVDVLIDMSDDKVVVNSCSEGVWIDNNDPERGWQPYIKGAIKLDITKLKGAELIPGCSSAVDNKDILRFQLKNVYSEGNFSLPNALQTSTSPGANWTEEIQDVAKKSYLAMILDPSQENKPRISFTKNENGDITEVTEDDLLVDYAKGKLGTLVGEESVDTYISFAKLGRTDEIIELGKKQSLSKTSSNPEGHKNIVNLYCSGEQDSSKQKHFAIERFRGLVKQELSSSASSKSVSDRIAEASKLILAPLYTNEKELKADQKNVVFEELAEHAAPTISSVDPKDHQKAVNLFCLVDNDPSSQKQFALERLSGCLETLLASDSSNSHDGKTTITLDNETAKKMKEAIISILGEACTDKEREALEKNAGKIVRECADEAKTSMSRGQRFKRIIDHVQDLFKKHTAKDIIKEHPEIKATLKKNLSQKKSDSKRAKSTVKTEARSL